METSKKYYFIVNPASRSGQGLKLWHRLLPDIRQSGIDYRVYFTKKQFSAEHYAAHITGNLTAPVVLIVMGGDGTLNETVNGISNHALVTLGYIPTGSSNDFSRAHGSGKNSSEALHQILLGQTIQMIDIGQVQAGKHLTKKFIVSAGIGYDAAVTTGCNRSRLKKGLNMFHLGKLSYLLVGAKQLFTRKTETMTVSFDGRAPQTFRKVFFISVHNHRYEGGGFAFAPKADPSDGMLDVCIIEGLGVLRLIPVLLASAFGAHIHFRGVHNVRCRFVSVIANSAQQIHADGEDCGQHRLFEAECLSEKLRVII